MKEFVVQVLAYEPLFVNKRIISETSPFQGFLVSTLQVMQHRSQQITSLYIASMHVYILKIIVIAISSLLFH